jgi:[acyl-carrier-protein] S-malonyltransferase
MDPVAERLAEALAGIELKPAGVPVVHNVDAAHRDSPAGIRSALAEQVRRPVRWVECVQAMRALGVKALVEAGPGRVLCGLARRIDRELAAWPVDDPDSLATALNSAREIPE